MLPQPGETSPIAVDPANTTHRPNVGQCWPTVYDVGPALFQRWIDLSCLLGTL